MTLTPTLRVQEDTWNLLCKLQVQKETLFQHKKLKSNILLHTGTHTKIHMHIHTTHTLNKYNSFVKSTHLCIL